MVKINANYNTLDVERILKNAKPLKYIYHYEIKHYNLQPYNKSPKILQ